MGSATTSYDEREADRVVQEYLERDLLEPALAKRVAELREQNRPTEALRDIRSERRD